MSAANLAILAGFFGGAVGWLVRSVFDIFYLHAREKKQIKKIIKSDLMSILSTASYLNQKEFLVALSRRENVDDRLLSKQYILASIRSKDVDTRVIDRFGPNILKIDDQLLGEILNVYRRIISVRLILNQLFERYEESDSVAAQELAKVVLPMFIQVEKLSSKLCEKL